VIEGERPKVSIILPAYQSEVFLSQTIQSILDQNYLNFELLICNDGSTDSTSQIIKAFLDRDERIRVITLVENRGVGYCYQVLLHECRGEFIAQIGHDDVWLPDFLQKMTGALECNSAASAAFSKVKVIDQNGEQSTVKSPFRIDVFQSLDQYEQAFELFTGNAFCASGSLVKSQFLRDWDTLGDIDQLQDWATWMQLVLRGPLIILNETLVLYRIHGSNLSYSKGNPVQLDHEAMLCRYQMLSSRDFGRLLRTQRQPGRALMMWLEFFVQASPPIKSTVSLLLEIALRNNNLNLSDFDEYHEFMTRLALERGLFSRAGRHQRAAAALGVVSKYGTYGSERWWIIHLGPEIMPLASPLYKVWLIGPICIIQIPLSREPHWPISFSVSLSSKRETVLSIAEKCMHRNLYSRIRGFNRIKARTLQIFRWF
jgi:glycosyltransferase involved in cell wall biosynthesis